MSFIIITSPRLHARPPGSQQTVTELHTIRARPPRGAGYVQEFHKRMCRQAERSTDRKWHLRKEARARADEAGRGDKDAWAPLLPARYVPSNLNGRESSLPVGFAVAGRMALEAGKLFTEVARAVFSRSVLSFFEF